MFGFLIKRIEQTDDKITYRLNNLPSTGLSILLLLQYFFTDNLFFLCIAAVSFCILLIQNIPIFTTFIRGFRKGHLDNDFFRGVFTVRTLIELTYDFRLTFAKGATVGTYIGLIGFTCLNLTGTLLLVIRLLR